MREFRDKVAVVTGAASGIGRALAERCAQEGMKVVLADISADNLARVETELKAAGATVLSVPTDVTKGEDIETLAQKTLDAFGAVHLLFNNAGVNAGTSIWESTVSDWAWVLGVNLWGVIHGVRIFVPIMLEQDTECHLVNTASISGLISGPALGVYKASKHAVVSLTETLFHELRLIGAKVKVSVLCPGSVDTNIMNAERTRPAELQNEPASSLVSPEQEKLGQFMQQSIQAGIPPRQVATQVFEAIKAEKFYILTHPDMNYRIQDRLEDILQGRDPTETLEP